MEEISVVALDLPSTHNLKKLSFPRLRSKWGRELKGGGLPLEFYKIQDVNPHPHPLPQAGEGVLRILTENLSDVTPLLTSPRKKFMRGEENFFALEG